MPLKEAVYLKDFADESAAKILNRILVKRYKFDDWVLPEYLDAHQRQGVSWIMTRSRSYLAHAPGAGKTCEAITAACLTPGEGSVLFVVPPTATANWGREIDLWGKQNESAAGLTGHVIPETASQGEMDWNAHFIICPDSMLSRPWVLARLTKIHFKFVAVDEASRFKEQTAQRTIALFGGTLKDGNRSPGLIQNARHAVLLDGSPMPNRPIELWCPTFAMAPETIGFLSYEEFGHKFCGATYTDHGNWEYKHSSNEEELSRLLKHDFMHVVAEAALNHPERLRSLLFLTSDVRSREQKTWEKNNVGKFSLADLDEEASRGDLARFRRELGMRKIPFIARYVSEKLEKNESILLFAWHRDVVNGLADKLTKNGHRPGVVLGGTPNFVREKLFARFQAGQSKLLIMNIASGGRCHNLQKADRVIFGEYSWTDENNTQAEKRASRKGSKKSCVRCDYIVNPDSLDEIILSAVMRKAKTIERIIK